MKAALIGLPQSGKSTLLSAVTDVPIDPHRLSPEPHPVVVHVPDARLAYLAKLSHAKKTTEATIELVDCPGCSLDEPHGQEHWRHLLPAVRQADLLVVVLRDFENAAVPPYRNRIDALADFSVVWQELLFADLESVTSRIGRIEASLKKPTRAHDAEKRELALLTRCREALENEKPLSSALHSEEDRRQVASFAFLTEKPILAVRNVGDSQLSQEVDWKLVHASGIISVCAAIEAEIVRLDAQDRPAFIADLGIQTLARERLIQACYRACKLISFLTMNADEARAWTVPQGTTAVEAAARVHTDFGHGFIRAETVSYQDLVTYKDMKGARAAGHVRAEGKSYVVADGDVLYILATTH